jgi:hypothetical protein
MKLLLTVEDAFLLTGRQPPLVVAPPVPRELAREVFGDRAGRHTCDVLLRRPDGGEAKIQAVFSVEFFVPTGAKWMCWPLDIGKGDVPKGTEVWLLDGTGE